MKTTNKNICNNAKVRKNPLRDEFYTTAETADRMIAHVVPGQFKDKRVYCNCDGPESEIYKLFKRRFAELGLKSLLATKYVPNGHGVKTFFDGQTETMSELDGNGDCFSDECKAFLADVDIVATNPPFSRMGDWIPDMIDAGKDIVVICNVMNLLYKRVKPIFLTGRLSFASVYRGGTKFVHANGHIAGIKVCGVTTLKCEDSTRQPSLTTAELEAKGKLNKDDATGEMEVGYLRHVPIDLEGTCLVPMTCLLSSKFKEKYEVLGLCQTMVTVNGKNRFFRIRVRRRTADETK